MSTPSRIHPDSLLPRPAPKRALVDGPLAAITFAREVNAPLHAVLADAVSYMRRIPSDQIFDLAPNWSMDTGWVVILYLHGSEDRL